VVLNILNASFTCCDTQTLPKGRGVEELHRQTHKPTVALRFNV